MKNLNKNIIKHLKNVKKELFAINYVLQLTKIMEEEELVPTYLNF